MTTLSPFISVNVKSEFYAVQSQRSITWEQRKVSELFRVTRGYVLAATQTETTKIDEKPYPVYSSQTKDKGLMGYYKDYLYEDAITWTTDGANAGTVNYRAGKFYCTNVCGVLLSNEVKANQMIAEALNSVAKGYVSYVGNPKLMNNVMADIVIQIPTQAEEREQLSSFFAKLDNLITLHQRKQKQKSPLITASLVIYGSICFDCFMSVSNTSYILFLSSGVSFSSFSFSIEFLTVYPVSKQSKHTIPHESQIHTKTSKADLRHFQLATRQPIRFGHRCNRYRKELATKADCFHLSKARQDNLSVLD